PAQLVGQRLPPVDEIERRRVETVAQPRRRWAVSEDVPQVTVATPATDLGPHHPVRAIGQLLDVPFGDTAGEAGPPGPRVELVRRVEHRQTTELAHVGALPLVVQQVTAKSRLGALLQQYASLLVREGVGQSLPFFVAERREVELARCAEELRGHSRR